MQYSPDVQGIWNNNIFPQNCSYFFSSIIKSFHPYPTVRLIFTLEYRFQLIFPTETASPIQFHNVYMYFFLFTNENYAFPKYHFSYTHLMTYLLVLLFEEKNLGTLSWNNFLAIRSSALVEGERQSERGMSETGTERSGRDRGWCARKHAETLKTQPSHIEPAPQVPDTFFLTFTFFFTLSLV